MTVSLQPLLYVTAILSAFLHVLNVDSQLAPSHPAAKNVRHYRVLINCLFLCLYVQEPAAEATG